MTPNEELRETVEGTIRLIKQRIARAETAIEQLYLDLDDDRDLLVAWESELVHLKLVGPIPSGNEGGAQ